VRTRARLMAGDDGCGTNQSGVTVAPFTKSGLPITSPVPLAALGGVFDHRLFENERPEGTDATGTESSCSMMLLYIRTF
jgi:hypothetical protein